MDERVFELRQYLPLRFCNSENQDYIEYLVDAYISNVQAEKYQFAFIAFHMLYMCYIYRTAWLLKKLGHNNIQSLFAAQNKLQFCDSLFDISVIEEKVAFRFLKALQFHDNQLKDFTISVDIRNNCAHTSGIIQYDESHINRYIDQTFEFIGSIEDKLQPLLLNAFQTFIEENNQPDQRQYSTSVDAVDDFIMQFYLSENNLGFLGNFDFGFMNEKSDNSAAVYSKVLYLVFILCLRKYGLFDDDRFISMVPMLVSGFHEQNDVLMENIINDDFAILMDLLANEEKAKFEKIVNVPFVQKYKLVAVG